MTTSSMRCIIIRGNISGACGLTTVSSTTGLWERARSGSIQKPISDTAYSGNGGKIRFDRITGM